MRVYIQHHPVRPGRFREVREEECEIVVGREVELAVVAAGDDVDGAARGDEAQ
jgi:hypothetical protein